MSSSRWIAVCAATCALTLGLAACGGGGSTDSAAGGDESSGSAAGGDPVSATTSAAAGEIAGAGSTAQQAAQEAWIAEFENAAGGDRSDRGGLRQPAAQGDRGLRRRRFG